MSKATKEYNELSAQIRQGNYFPIYVLAGDEPYFIDKLTRQIEHGVLPEEERSFNQVVLYGNETDPQTVAAEAKQFPMMSEYRVVIVKEAQWMDKIEDLLSYAEQPSPTTVLVLAMKGKSLRKNSKLAKAVLKNGGYMFTSEKVRDYELPEWISTAAAAQQLKMSPAAATLMAENLGTDLSRIDNELKKMTNGLPAGTSIDEKIVSEYVGISREYNVFELQKAISKGDFRKAIQIADFFGNNERAYPIFPTLGSLWTYYQKISQIHDNPGLDDRALASKIRMNPYFLKEYRQAARTYDQKKVARALMMLNEYDLKAKGVDNQSASQGDLLKEFLFRAMH